MARRNDAQGNGSPTLIHKIILGALGILDIGAIGIIFANDVTKLASRRGIMIDGTIIGFAVFYCLVLAAIHFFGVFHVASTSDSKKAASLRESKLTGMGEMILFTGLLMILVGFLIIGPGIATWSILLALVMIVIGGILVAVGINRTVLKAALIAMSVRRRNRKQPAPQHQQ